MESTCQLTNLPLIRTGLSTLGIEQIKNTTLQLTCLLVNVAENGLAAEAAKARAFTFG